MSGKFVHLHLHTEYSLLDGAVRILKGKESSPLADALKQKNMSAVAITDHGNMYGVLTFAGAMKKAGVQGIIGCEFYMTDDMLKKDPNRRDYDHLVLLAKTEKGYHNLMELNSAAFVDGFYVKPRIDLALLEKHSEGLVCLSACLAGRIPTLLLENNYAGALAYAKRLQGIFGADFYIEIQDHGLREQKLTNPDLVKIAKEIGAKVVATNDVHYLEREDADVQDTMLCIQTGKKKNDAVRMRFTGEEFYLKSPEEMEELFAWCPEAVSNTLEVAEKCQFELNTKSSVYYIPEFNACETLYQDAVKNMPKMYESRIQEEFDREQKRADAKAAENSGKTAKNSEKINRTRDTAATYLRRLTYAKLGERYKEVTKEIDDRIEYELDTIISLGYAEYYLVVWDFIRFAKETGVPVGPGRGSGAGSIIAYIIEITDVDPIRFNLIFERFLNRERVSMPDFDIDFCENRRGEVIKYVQEKYGKDNVSQIIAYSTMSAKAAIKDVARVYDIPFNEANDWVKGLPYGKITIEGCLGKGERPSVVPDFKKLYEENSVAKGIIDTAIKLEGMPRQPSIHAAGVVICRDRITEHCPLQRNGPDITTQFDKNQVEAIGLLKMDFLGLTTLTDISLAVEYIKKNRGIDIDFSKIGDDDPKIFELISSGDTMAVFQLESGGMTQFMARLKPENIEDITAGIALFRPGPMQFMDAFISGKNEPGTASYLHPALEPILNVTYGCIIYQEQVMEIARRLAGYTYGGSDILRRAMGKKDLKAMQKNKAIFIHGDKKEGVPGAVKNGIPEKIADELFEQILKFAEYAFNKAHAAAYAVLTYRTAYLKSYFFLDYMTAVINNRLLKPDKLTANINYVKSKNVEIKPPCINKSEVKFSIEDGALRFGLLGIKNVGEQALNAIIKDRGENGEYKNFYDFLERAANLAAGDNENGTVRAAAINKRMVESLIKGGAFDCFGLNRPQMLACYEQIMDMVQKEKKGKVDGQISFFDFAEEEDTPDFEYPKVPDMDKLKKLEMEKEVLGMYVTGHPLDDYKASFKGGFTVQDLVLQEIDEDALAEAGEDGAATAFDTSYDGRHVTIYGLAGNASSGYAKRSKKSYIKGDFEDLTGTISFMMFNENKPLESQLLISGVPLILKGRLSVKKDELPSIFVSAVEKWEKAGEAAADVPNDASGEKTGSEIYVNIADFETAKSLMPLLKQYPGADKIHAVMPGETKPFRVCVKTCDDLLFDLQDKLGKGNVTKKTLK